MSGANCPLGGEHSVKNRLLGILAKEQPVNISCSDLLLGDFFLGVLFSLYVFCPPNLSAQKRRIELEDFAKIVAVSDPQISPDGKSIVCVVSRANLEQD